MFSHIPSFLFLSWGQCLATPDWLMVTMEGWKTKCQECWQCWEQLRICSSSASPPAKKNPIFPLPASCVFAPGEQESRAQGLPASGRRWGGEREPSQWRTWLRIDGYNILYYSTRNLHWVLLFWSPINDSPTALYPAISDQRRSSQTFIVGTRILRMEFQFDFYWSCLTLGEYEMKCADSFLPLLKLLHIWTLF